MVQSEENAAIAEYRANSLATGCLLKESVPRLEITTDHPGIVNLGIASLVQTASWLDYQGRCFVSIVLRNTSLLALFKVIGDKWPDDLSLAGLKLV